MASWHTARNRAIIESGVSPFAASLCANLGRCSVSLNSISMGSERNNRACPPNAAESTRADGPCQSDPEIRILVSATSLTCPFLSPHFLHLRLDLFHPHRFPRLGSDLIQQTIQFRRGLPPT